jgi:predicted metalloprotease
VDERRYGSEVEANHASVRLELQADYLAGVWAYHGQQKFNFLEPGDIDSALHAAFRSATTACSASRAATSSRTRSRTARPGNGRRFGEGLKSGDVRKAAVLFEVPYNKL